MNAHTRTQFFGKKHKHFWVTFHPGMGCRSCVAFSLRYGLKLLIFGRMFVLLEGLYSVDFGGPMPLCEHRVC